MITATTIEEFVRSRGGGVTFVELTQHIDGARGDQAITLGPSENNVVIWSGVSHELIDAVRDALNYCMIEIRQASVMVYMIDGGLLRLPIAKSCRPYKQERWLPVVFNVAPLLGRRNKRRAVSRAVQP